MTPEDIVKANQEFYDQNAGDYESFQWYFRNRYMQRFWQNEIDRIAKGIGRRPFTVLDVGCGTGNLTRKFLKHDCRITAMDVSRNMLDLLEKNLTAGDRDRVSFEVNSLDGFISGTHDQFDAVVECSVLHHLLDYELYLQKVERLLRPGGLVLITREPVAKTDLAPPSPLASLVDRLISGGQARTLRSMERRGLHRPKKAPDHSLAALHYYRDGISFKRLMQAAGGAFEIVSHKTYNRRFISFYSWLENTVFNGIRKERFQYTFFSAILRKKDR